ncbi:prion-like-(Q/N-rich) domain-bearing protein 25 isoform X1 [Microplitis demolitor]|uniref:prion-like-(Q/N-rich) domain-bearing protein 25 isoform X1 n=1 Tax=Microplitis demolitor TaxID=69319 RepID=UPI0004CCDB62|nr:prion-like-(Q/N-rich) domain-bearing protein 25 isoform X1 [Microplitis demolitor]
MVLQNQVLIFAKILAVFLMFTESTNDHLFINKTDEIVCATYFEKCDIAFPTPCCNQNHKCSRIGWGSLRTDLRCLLQAFLGDFCETDYDCGIVNHSKCSEDHKCECRPNYATIGKSLCLSQQNGFCLSNEECTAQNSVCINSKCGCKLNFILGSENKCEPKQLDTFCNSDEDCAIVNHAKCSKDKKCICRPNNVVINETCVPMINGFCWGGEPCAAENSVCMNQTCQCKEGFKFIPDNYCVKTYLGMPCQKNQDCEEIRNAKCSEDKECVCELNAIKLNQSMCISLINGSCENDQECAPENSICMNNECQCKLNYVPTHKNQCEQVTLGKPCEKTLNCRDVWHETCSEDKRCVYEHCYVDNSYCPAYNCKCRPNYIEISKNQCVLDYSLTPCQNDEDCGDIKRRECSEHNQCVCKPNTISLYNSKCVPIIGGFCINDEECYVNNSVCIDNRCQCKLNYYFLSNYLCVESIR